MDTYIEISTTNKHGTPPVLIHREDIEGLTGFRSVYEYPVETCQWIRSNGGIAGLTAARMPVYADRLLMDFDNDEASAAKYIASLKAWNITHSVWNSGGRSIHIHVLTEPRLGPDVPYSQKSFVERWGNDIGAMADTSFYHSSGLFRLPDTLHESTGKPKILLEQHWGGSLSYPMLESKAKPYKAGDDISTLTTVWRLLLTPVANGGRRFHIYKIVTNASILGWDENKILDHLKEWNKWQPPPLQLSEAELETKLWKSL